MKTALIAGMILMAQATQVQWCWIANGAAMVCYATQAPCEAQARSGGGFCQKIVQE